MKKAREITEKELNQVKDALRCEREKTKKKLDLHLVKVLELKPNKKYMLFFPVNSGISKYDLQCFSSKWLADINFLLESTEGIMVIEK